jgi:hypothetical protein
MKPYLSNPSLLKLLIPSLAPITCIKDLKEGDTITELPALFAQVNFNDYNGCSVCFSKLQGEAGSSISCTSGKCQGEMRIVKAYRMWFVTGGDPTGTANFIFLPFHYELDNGNELIGKVGLVTGFASKPYKMRSGEERIEITVKNLRIIDDFKDEKTKAKTQSPSSSPTSAPPPITSLEQVKLLFHIHNNKITEENLNMGLKRLGMEKKQIEQYLESVTAQDGRVFYSIKDVQ